MMQLRQISDVLLPRRWRGGRRQPQNQQHAARVPRGQARAGAGVRLGPPHEGGHAYGHGGSHDPRRGHRAPDAIHLRQEGLACYTGKGERRRRAGVRGVGVRGIGMHVYVHVFVLSRNSRVVLPVKEACGDVLVQHAGSNIGKSHTCCIYELVVLAPREG